MRRPVWPILIGNRDGPLLQVIVEIGKVDPSDVFPRNDVRLSSLSFSLAGTDDLGDLQSLRLLSTGDVEELRLSRRPTPSGAQGRTRVTPVGDPVPPAPALTLPIDWPLRAGKNVFWLSCRLRDSADLYHRIAAACTAVTMTAGTLRPRDSFPARRQRIGVALRKHGDDGVDTYVNPALATTPQGTLLCVYDMRWRAPGHDLQDLITIWLSRSATGGKSWDPVRIIMDMGEYGGLPREQNGCSDPGIIVDRQTGEIFSFSIWMNGKPGHHQWVGNGSEPGYEIGKSAQFLVVRSRDDGRTWSRPENLTRKLKRAAWWLLAPAPQQGIQLDDGTLVMPEQGRNEKGMEISTLMTSRDHGANWTVATPAYSRGSECQAAQLGDGSLMLNIRNEEKESETYHYRAVFVTRDLGRSWHPHPTNLNTLIEPNCNASLLRVDYHRGR